MSAPKPQHHRGSYQRLAKRVTDAAWANPATRCIRCGLTLQAHKPHRNGRRPWWTAGHLVDGQVDGELGPEASTCNYAAGGRLAQARRTAAARKPPLQTTIQW